MLFIYRIISTLTYFLDILEGPTKNSQATNEMFVVSKIYKIVKGAVMQII